MQSDVKSGRNAAVSAFCRSPSFIILHNSGWHMFIDG